MIRIELQGKWYDIPEGWNELTLGKFIEICSIEIPKKLEKLWTATSKLATSSGKKEQEQAEAEYNAIFDQITFKDNALYFPEYYGKVMQVFDIPSEVIDLILYEPRTDFFDRYLKYIILSAYTMHPLMYTDSGFVPYESEKVDELIIDNEHYFLPKSLKLLGNTRELAGEPIVSFAEASAIEIMWDDMKTKGVEMLPAFAAIYLRKKDEKYSEAVVMSRAEKFKELTMANFWTVFFCTSQLAQESASNTLSSLNLAVQDRLLKGLDSLRMDTEEVSTKLHKMEPSERSGK